MRRRLTYSTWLVAQLARNSSGSIETYFIKMLIAPLERLILKVSSSAKATKICSESSRESWLGAPVSKESATKALRNDFGDRQRDSY
jgi:hypothetical protein